MRSRVPNRALRSAPLMLKKLIWTTVLSAAIYAVCAWGYYAGLFNLDRLMRLMGVPF